MTIKAIIQSYEEKIKGKLVKGCFRRTAYSVNKLVPFWTTEIFEIGRDTHRTDEFCVASIHDWSMLPYIGALMILSFALPSEPSRLPFPT